ncbi:MAG: alpha/beta fold hydrolase, partial [Anaerolineae bacterium]|nr:alpha/beta fold hydrolase [Anaerolineae bacterium]
VQGKYQEKPTLPFAPGLEAAGEVVALGPDIKRLKVGDRILTTPPFGGFAEFATSREEFSFVIPDSMDFDVAAGFPVTYGTAHAALRWHLDLQPGQTLVVHGAGGGYDQGLVMSRAFGGDGFQWIAPSRFGYLRTPLPADASTAVQADAFADLLDTVGIQRVALVAHSGGVPPALQFALRHPDRTSALVVMSGAPYTGLAIPDQKLPMPLWVYQALFSSDFPYWALEKVAQPRLATIYDATPTLQAKMTPEEAAVVSDIVAGMEPVTWRVNGVRNDELLRNPGHLQGRNMKFSRIWLNTYCWFCCAPMPPL